RRSIMRRIVLNPVLATDQISSGIEYIRKTGVSGRESRPDDRVAVLRAGPVREGRVTVDQRRRRIPSVWTRYLKHQIPARLVQIRVVPRAAIISLILSDGACRDASNGRSKSASLHPGAVAAITSAGVMPLRHESALDRQRVCESADSVVLYHPATSRVQDGRASIHDAREVAERILHTTVVVVHVRGSGTEDATPIAPTAVGAVAVQIGERVLVVESAVAVVKEMKLVEILRAVDCGPVRG